MTYDTRPPHEWQQDGIREILARQKRLNQIADGCLSALIIIALELGFLVYKAL